MPASHVWKNASPGMSFPGAGGGETDGAADAAPSGTGESRSAVPGEERHKSALTFVKAFVFLLILSWILLLSDLTLRNKGIENDDYSAVSTAAGFYWQKRNSVDVIFLGSSNSYCAFSPERLKERTGLTGYNLASSQQSVLTSFYWLCEALRYQKPKAVVLDTYYLFFTLGNEGSVRKAFDWMRMSPEKRAAAAELEKIDKEKFPLLSFYFPLVRYHTRWKDITREEIFGERSWFALSRRTAYLGYCPRNEVIGDTSYTPLKEDGSVLYTSLETDDGEPTSQMESAKITDLARKYTEKIADVCRHNGIRFILVKTPISWWSMKEHEAVESLAEDLGAEFYDLNMASAIEAMDFDYARDAADHLHANRSGAVKITDYTGKILKEEPE